MIDFSKILFLDIETVSHEKDFSQLSERMQKLWSHKAEQIGKGDETATPESLYERASIYALPHGMIRHRHTDLIIEINGCLRQRNDNIHVTVKYALLISLANLPQLIVG